MTRLLDTNLALYSVACEILKNSTSTSSLKTATACLDATLSLSHDLKSISKEINARLLISRVFLHILAINPNDSNKSTLESNLAKAKILSAGLPSCDDLRFRVLCATLDALLIDGCLENARSVLLDAYALAWNSKKYHWALVFSANSGGLSTPDTNELCKAAFPDSLRDRYCALLHLVSIRLRIALLSSNWKHMVHLSGYEFKLRKKFVDNSIPIPRTLDDHCNLIVYLIYLAHGGDFPADRRNNVISLRDRIPDSSLSLLVSLGDSNVNLIAKYAQNPYKSTCLAQYLVGLELKRRLSIHPALEQFELCAKFIKTTASLASEPSVLDLVLVQIFECRLYLRQFYDAAEALLLLARRSYLPDDQIMLAFGMFFQACDRFEEAEIIFESIMIQEKSEIATISLAQCIILSNDPLERSSRLEYASQILCSNFTQPQLSRMAELLKSIIDVELTHQSSVYIESIEKTVRYPQLECLGLLIGGCNYYFLNPTEAIKCLWKSLKSMSPGETVFLYRSCLKCLKELDPDGDFTNTICEDDLDEFTELSKAQAREESDRILKFLEEQPVPEMPSEQIVVDISE